MSDLLKEICRRTYQDVQARKQHPLPKRSTTPPRGFVQAVQSKTPATALICEIKKASPSAGLIRPDFCPATLAQSYEKAGAVCLSVLTEPHYFQGNVTHLQEAREACTLPVLRKDFMVDTWQVDEAYGIGADCILIIIAALSPAQAQALLATANELGLDCLIEVHTKAELDIALNLDLSPKHHLIGINNRNLKTLSIDLKNSLELVEQANDSGCTIISESGIKTIDDINRLKKVGIHSFLIGESLLKQPDIEGAVQVLL